MRQESLIFKPYHGRIKPLYTPDHYGLEDVDIHFIKTEDNVRLELWSRASTNENAPTFVFFSGNTGHLGDVGRPDPDEDYDREYRLNFLRELVKQGIGFLAISMRGYGNSQKVKISEAGFDVDINSICKFIKQNIPADKLAIVGESMGANLALKATCKLAELNHAPKACGIVAAFSTMKEKVCEMHPRLRYFNMDKYIRHPFDSEKLVASLPPETFLYIAHPANDETTPIHHSTKLYSISQHHNKKSLYQPLNHAGHITWNAEDVIRDVLGVGKWSI